MSAVAVSQRERAKRAQRSRNGPVGILRLWPLVVGVLIAVFIERIAATVAIAAPEASKFVLPLPYLVRGHTFWLPTPYADDVSQLSTYLQYPWYGLFLMVLCRWFQLHTALIFLITVHLILFIFAAYILRT